MSPALLQPPWVGSGLITQRRKPIAAAIEQVDKGHQPGILASKGTLRVTPMNWISDEIIGVLTFLLPGLVTSVIFHSLTSHRKPSPFDRITSALVFTILIKYIISILNSLIPKINDFLPDSLIKIMVISLLGLAISCMSNKDIPHKWLRRLGITKETSYSSELAAMFMKHGDKAVIMLYLKENRYKLYGRLVEWPRDPQNGYFRIIDVDWIDDENNQFPFDIDNAAILIPAAEVRMLALAPMLNREKGL